MYLCNEILNMELLIKNVLYSNLKYILSVHYILWLVCITYFYNNGMHNIPKNGVLSVRRNYTPKKCVIHTIVLTVYSYS